MAMALGSFCFGVHMLLHWSTNDIYCYKITAVIVSILNMILSHCDQINVFDLKKKEQSLTELPEEERTVSD